MADRSYDREFTPAVSGRARRRVGFSRENGEITRFVVQLEYRLGDGWIPVVRYDHGPGDGEHDVTDEGLHIDIYRDEEIAELREAMGEQRKEILEALAEDLGGDPEDYRID